MIIGVFFTIIHTKVYAHRFHVEIGLSIAYFKNYLKNLGENTLNPNYSKTAKQFIEVGFRLTILQEIIDWVVLAYYSTDTIKTATFSGDIKVPLQYDIQCISIFQIIG